jgi:hypothetical protein
MAMRAATDLKEAHSGEIFLEHKRKVGRLYIYIYRFFFFFLKKFYFIYIARKGQQ